ncbi:amidase [Tengunoibacter tsumagoiensis]|uniref:Amidase n=1 Tax=Tengunoibacter tsumagoiensis TaxID=2014871 RepID=A0A402A0Q0_9CHLR|nr:amidase [Tengunoibacter tsumagoiensis]GCE12727.1 amidase [Tengunoibacter tsumagoiensis]
MHIEEATIAELQAAMSQGKLTACQLTELYIERIQTLNPQLHAILEINPDALKIANALDQERASTGPRGPLHGIPVLLKDNIATADLMETTAGSLALLGARPPRDAFVAQKLREAGAVILGKTNLSEWANFRSSASASGWSARGGVARNPYVLDRTVCGSSSGSASAISANLAVVSLGTETDGSILCPAGITGVVGIKPTVGLTSRAGVIPIAHSQDTVGPFARTVTDAAILLGAITGVDERDPFTGESANHFHKDYTPFLDKQGLKGARIGVSRQVYFGYSPKADAIINTAIQELKELGAIIIDPADIPTARQMAESEAEMKVLLHELKADMNAYLSELGNTEMHTLADLIAFNTAHAEEELIYFGQEHFLQAQETGDLNDPDYLAALAENHRLSRQEGIDKVMNDYQLDALVMPTVSPAWTIDLVNGDHYTGSSSQPAALAGYPAITVPAGYSHGLPVGITFMGRAYSEPTLIRLAYAFEQSTLQRRAPQFLPTIQ